MRSLAQRSAQAAREIKSLITHSVEQVDAGTALVDRAGQTMQDIVASVRRVTDIVAEISSASTEQSSGVTQVAQAVSEMDRATQQNAALVEQSVASDESLRQQAEELVHAVSAFRVAAAGALGTGAERSVPSLNTATACSSWPACWRMLSAAAALSSTSAAFCCVARSICVTA